MILSNPFGRAVIYTSTPERMGVYLLINSSHMESLTGELPTEAERYTLAGKNGNIRVAVMTLNDKPLALAAGMYSLKWSL